MTNCIDQKTNTQYNIKVRVIIWLVQLIMFTGLLLSLRLLFVGNQFILSNTLKGWNISILAFIPGIIFGFIPIFFMSTKLKSIRYNYFQETIGLFLFSIPILTIYYAYSLNLSLSEDIPENFKMTILAKGSDDIFRTKWIEINYKNDKKVIRITNERWNNYSINDSIPLTIICGYFGNEIVRFQD